YIPHYIRGDLDSLRDDVRDFYISKVSKHSIYSFSKYITEQKAIDKGTEVEQDPDQNSTDFMKCIELVRRKERESSVKVW
ncbi:475_t:CDS:1, partial [Racocetra fulgida]